jgi:hypothetical protein
MATTLKSNLIIPEVLASVVESKLTDKMVFLPIADVDDTLVGQPGDTIKFPSFNYIGDADAIAENNQIVPVALTSGYTSATVAKTGKGVQITDEAMLSGYGDPVNEAGVQIATSIDNKADKDLLTALLGVGASRHYGTTADMSADLVADALTVFGEDVDGAKVIMVSPSDIATLRKDSDFIRASDLGQAMILRGAIGEIWGCQIIAANKIANNATTGEFWRFIVKPGALKLIRKRNVMVELDREPDYGRTTVYANHHYTCYLYDESKVAVIRKFTALKTLTSGVTSTAGTTATNDTFIGITVPAPLNFRWVYKLGTADVSNAAIGTALTGYTDWVSGTTEIAASTNTKAHVCLVGADDKPVKQINIALVKKA